MLKRTMDLFLLLLGSSLIVLLVGTIYIKMKLSEKGDVFFVQPRLGKNKEVFNCWKFRSMVHNAEEILAEYLANNEEIRKEYEFNHKLQNDPRITPLGQKLRNTSMDELPQLWNVLKGEMSLVGPRPYLVSELEDMGKAAEKILSVKPGITGYWQVNGRSEVDFCKRLEMDEYYVDNRSMWMDIAILFKTVGVVLGKKGAY